MKIKEIMAPSIIDEKVLYEYFIRKENDEKFLNEYLIRNGKKENRRFKIKQKVFKNKTKKRN